MTETSLAGGRSVDPLPTHIIPILSQPEFAQDYSLKLFA